MENNFLLTDDMLWDYADGLLTTAEKSRVDAYLRQHPEHRARLDGILLEKKALSSLPLEKTSRGFGDQVMAAWVSQQAKTAKALPKKDWVLRLISSGFALLIAIPIVYLFFSNGSKSTFSMPELPMFWQQLDWSTMFSGPAMVYGFLLLLTLLGLQLLDKFLKVAKI